MSTYLGNYPVGLAVIDHFFTTVDSLGAPTSLVGSPTIACYKTSSSIEETVHIGLITDVDGRVGLNMVRVFLADDTSFYSAGGMYHIVLTAGTVGGVSVNGYVVAEFGIVYEVANVTQVNGSNIANLVGGRMDSHVGSIADGVLAAAKFAAGAFDAVWTVASRLLTAGTNVTDTLETRLSAVRAGFLDSLAPTFQGKAWFTVDDGASVDRYSIRWYLNGVPFDSAVSGATIAVINLDTLATHIAATAMSSDAQGRWTYEASGAERIVPGVQYEVIFSGDVSGTPVKWTQQVSRDG